MVTHKLPGELDLVRKSDPCSFVITLELSRAMLIQRSQSTSEMCNRWRHNNQKLWRTHTDFCRLWIK